MATDEQLDKFVELFQRKFESDARSKAWAAVADNPENEYFHEDWFDRFLETVIYNCKSKDLTEQQIYDAAEIAWRQWWEGYHYARHAIALVDNEEWDKANSSTEVDIYDFSFSLYPRKPA